METYEGPCLQMVPASEKALRAMEQQNFGTARSILIAAQQEGEERYLDQGGLEEPGETAEK